MRSALRWRTTTQQIKARRCLLDYMEQTGMGCMTWLGMCGSGLGTGMVLMPRLHRLTREGLVRARTACFAVAVGPALRRTAEWRPATTTPTLAPGPTTAGSALFCPQVNRSWSRWKLPAVASKFAAHPPIPESRRNAGPRNPSPPTAPPWPSKPPAT